MPLYRKMFLQDGSVLALWEIQETENELLSQISMDEKEEKELLMIKSPGNRLRWIASRIALRNLFDDNCSVNLQKDVHGKPFLSRLSGHISITHSGNMAAAMFHPKRKVGIDIELIRPKIFDIKDKFLSEREIQCVDENELNTLFVCWCTKEAIYKWYGKKGLSLKAEIAIRPFIYQENGILEATITTTKYLTFCIHYERIGDYMMAYLSC